jgi:hypothetical protein
MVLCPKQKKLDKIRVKNALEKNKLPFSEEEALFIQQCF